jgi:RNA polymerase sigma-70 factor (ECF subfamily)
MTDNILKYHSKLRHYALKLTKNTEDAEDLVQDTILRALENSDKFDGRNFIGWATTIMTNIYYNNKKRERAKFTQMFDHGQYSIDKSVDARIDLDKILSTIDERRRDIITLWGNGYSYKDMVAETGIKMVTIDYLLYSTKSIIRNQLKQKT